MGTYTNDDQALLYIFPLKYVCAHLKWFDISKKAEFEYSVFFYDFKN